MRTTHSTASTLRIRCSADEGFAARTNFGAWVNRVRAASRGAVAREVPAQQILFIRRTALTSQITSLAQPHPSSYTGGKRGTD